MHSYVRVFSVCMYAKNILHANFPSVRYACSKTIFIPVLFLLSVEISTVRSQRTYDLENVENDTEVTCEGYFFLEVLFPLSDGGTAARSAVILPAAKG